MVESGRVRIGEGKDGCEDGEVGKEQGRSDHYKSVFGHDDAGTQESVDKRNSRMAWKWLLRLWALALAGSRRTNDRQGRSGKLRKTPSKARTHGRHGANRREKAWHTSTMESTAQRGSQQGAGTLRLTSRGRLLPRHYQQQGTNTS